MKAQGGQGLVSRYSLTPFSPENCVDIGYDQLLDTYFLQVRRNRDEGAGTQLIKAIGTGVGTPETQGQITDPSVLVMEAGSFAKIPDDLIFSLYADRKTEATRFASDPVVYLCMRNKSVWRSRIGKDWQSRLESSPISGVQLEIRPSSHHSMNYVVAKAILRDFLGSHDRARRVTPVFSDTVISNMPVNRNSILTEKMNLSGLRKHPVTQAKARSFRPQNNCGDQIPIENRVSNVLQRQEREGNQQKIPPSLKRTRTSWISSEIKCKHIQNRRGPAFTPGLFSYENQITLFPVRPLVYVERVHLTRESGCAAQTRGLIRQHETIIAAGDGFQRDKPRVFR